MRWFLPWVFLALPASAGSLPVYEGPVPVTLGETRLVLQVEIVAEAIGPEGLRLVAQGEVTQAIPAAAKALRAEIGAIPRSCEDRLALRAVEVGVEAGAVAVRVGFRYARWICQKVFGRSVETEVLSEAATVTARLMPFVDDGRLQLRLAAFDVRDLGELARALDAERWLRAELERALATLNEDPGFAELPPPIRDEGYRYERVTLEGDTTPVLKVALTGPDSVLALLRIRAALTGK